MNRKKICFISLGNLYLCPYISKYTSILDCDFDIIYWDRHGMKENVSEAKKVYSFQYKMDEGKGKLSKALGYLKFKKYATEIIEKNNYNGVVLLQTSVGVILQSILRKKFKDKYIVDIRDYTMEKNPLFFILVKRLIENSSFTVISSKGYKNFLPKFDYVNVHNDFKIDALTASKFQNRERKKDKLVISYIGLIRFHEQNKKAILKFKNDDRYILRFIGKDAYALSEFCRINNVSNVELIDQFPPEKTLDYYFDTDIIYNLYGNSTPLLDYALSNKLYYAAKLRLPILVCPNTYMEKVTVENGFGYVFNLDGAQSCDELFNYYNSIEWDTFNENCKKFIKSVNRDNLLFNKAVLNFIDRL